MSQKSNFTESNKDLFERASRVIPGGVNSPVRAFKSVGGVPFFVDRGKGPYLYDVEGKKYIDYIQSYGATILGHADQAIIKAIYQAAELGSTYGAPTPGEVVLAEMIVDRVVGLDMVRLTSSGTEATMSAIRVARGFTKRDKVLKFDGCYHGHSDGLLVAGGSGVASLGIPDSVGVPAGSIENTVVAPYNQVPELDESFAAVIVEPVAANMGLVPAEPGFLEGLRQECMKHGVILIFDEVITGFRLGKGGASQYLGVTPDMWCFGKVIGGGLPIGAFGGRRDIMEIVSPLGPVYQAGTLSGNPLATAAGIAVLDQLTNERYETLRLSAKKFADGLENVFINADIDVEVPRVSSLVGLFFSNEKVVDYPGAKRSAATGLYPTFFHEMLNLGVAFAPGPYEAIFPSMSHSDDVIDETLERAEEVAAKMKRSKSLS